MSELLDDVVGEFAKLPGVGQRTALRLSLHLLRRTEVEVEQFVDAVSRFRTGIRYCKQCNNLSDGEVCPICSDPRRDRSVICVVEHVGDVMSIENTKTYKGLYHVLGDVISPMRGVGPSDLKIDLLVDNVVSGGVKEVILAIGTSMECETTMFYIKSRLKNHPEVKITTLARGIGFGDEIEYADEYTIRHALNNRQAL
ncbi:MAG: recombination protein RecR [Rikenellaceae bacterium]|jgi:recombination protein RecR|nr:recombination protein RecR [Rikenellaceae bacterium]